MIFNVISIQFTARVLCLALCGAVVFVAGCAVAPFEPVPEDALDARFGERVDGGEVRADHLVEISGAVASRRYPGLLWVHNDSGDSNRIYAIDRGGAYLGEVWLDGCEARDWEDMAAGGGPRAEAPYLYVGDIGDNLGIWRERRICRVLEPELPAAGQPFSMHVTAEVLRVRFGDAPRDAEALLVDPLTNDIYIVTKREPQVLLYRIPYPQPFGALVEVVPEGSLPLTKICAGEIAPDGSEILLKDLSRIYYWRREPGQSLLDTLRSPPRRLPYVREPQGEALAWERGGQGYFTLSEQVLLLPPHVYFYPRLAPHSAVMP